MVDEQFTPGSDADLFEFSTAAARNERIDDKLVRRVEEHAIALADSQTTVKSGIQMEPVTQSILSGPIAKRIVWAAAMAAGILIAFMILGPSGSGKAWAEVVQAIASEKWMRLTLQIPDELPDEAVDPEMKMWISGDRSTVAVQNRWESRWDNLAGEETWQFNKKTGRLRLSKTEVEDRAEMQFFVQLLDQLKGRKYRRGRIRGELVDSSREDVVVDGKEFTDFRFAYRFDNSQPPVEETIVRVDRETKRPVQLVSQRKGTKFPRVFLIDYPNDGPEDIYALGAPDDAPLDDVQSLAQLFPIKKPKNFADYEMIQLEFAVTDRKFPTLNWAYRYRKQGKKLTKELADPEKVLALGFKAYKSGRPLPSNKEELRWFTDQIRDYKFSPQETSESNYPHMKCYLPMGGAKDYEFDSRWEFDKAWTTSSTKIDLDECFVVGGPKRFVWFDPTRHMIMRRWETVQADGKNIAHCSQKVVQGPNGNWFPTRWTVSTVESPGGELARPRMQHVCEYKFDK